MRDRILGVEVEYSLFQAAPGGRSGISAAELGDRALEAARARFRMGSGSFLPNGGKLYMDVGHVEWASPECRGPREALLYDEAGERLLDEIAGLTEKRLAGDGLPGRVMVLKNNVDGHGNTFGCHENYLLERRSSLFGSDQELWAYLVRKLVPFLVSRQVLCGSGCWMKDEEQGFQISQRSQFINAVVAAETRGPRPLVNSRDEPHADPRRFRRLHLILGDANMAETSTLLKLGTTSLVLEMIEDVFLEDGPEPQNPVAALHAISRDPDLRVEVPLHGGRKATALDLQRYYLEAARTCFAGSPDDETRQILDRWEDALAKLAENPFQLFGKIDWVTKRALLTAHAQRQKLAWSDPRLRELDQTYHSIRSGDSVFCMLEGDGTIETLLDRGEVMRALVEPPPFTRAQVRGRAIARGGSVSEWATVQGCQIDDPLDWCPLRPLRALGLDDPGLAGWLSSGLTAASPEVRRQAVRGLRELGGPSAGPPLLDAAQDQDPEVRAAAVEALPNPPNRRARAALRRATSDPDFLVRLKAREALAGGS